MDLVPGDGERITVDLVNINRNLACGLYSVSVKEDIGLTRNFPYIVHRLDDPGFIIGHHDADQPGIRLNCLTQFIGFDLSAAIDRKVGHLVPHLLQAFAGIHDGTVLNAGSNHMIAVPHYAEDAEIVGFRASAGEDDLRRSRIQKRGNCCPCSFYGCAGVLSEMMDRGGIAELFQVVGPHGFEHFR